MDSGRYCKSVTTFVVTQIQNSMIADETLHTPPETFHFHHDMEDNPTSQQFCEFFSSGRNGRGIR